MYALTQLPHRGLNLFGNRLLSDGWFGDVERLATPPLGTTDRATDFAPALDIVETADGYEVKVELPGVGKEDLSVKVVDNTLTIEARSSDETAHQKGREVLKSERRIGKQYRALRLGDAVDENNIHATYKDGVLTVTLPRAATPEAKRIKVH